MEFLPELKVFLNQITTNFDSIDPERINNLNRLSKLIMTKHEENKKVSLTFVCTHNSRRSQFAQVWGHIAAKYYEIDWVDTFSGGTEITAFNERAVHSLRKTGFEISLIENDANPIYNLVFSSRENGIKCFSKLYDDPSNPDRDFIAVMTCADADQNCPYIPNAKQVPLRYEDPKAFDDSPEEEKMYTARSRQIATELFFVFSKISKA